MMYNVQPERSKDSIELPIENKVVNNDLAVAEYFNDYFATVADDLASTFPPTKVEYNHRVRSRFGCFTPVTEEEIRSVIGKLKRSESIISDAISSNIVKECAEIVTPAITNTVNVSLEKGFFPLAVNWLRLYRCLNRVLLIRLKIIDQSLSYLRSPKSLKRLLKLDFLLSWKNVMFYMQSNLGSGKN